MIAQGNQHWYVCTGLPTLIWLLRVTNIDMIAQGYQLWYDCTVSPTLTCLYGISNTNIIAQDINYKEVIPKIKKEILFHFNVLVGSLTRPMW